MRLSIHAFQLHIDPQLYNYKWDGPKYVTVTYLFDGTNVAVETISADFGVAGMIAAAGNWPDFANEVMTAARVNAGSLDRNGHVSPIINKALKPFIPY